MVETLAKTFNPGQLCPSTTVKAIESLAILSHLEEGQQHMSYLSLSVLTGMLFLCHRMTGSGRPWIWHWNLATPPSSTTAF